jgi:hypothetical protein
MRKGKGVSFESSKTPYSKPRKMPVECVIKRGKWEVHATLEVRS